MIFKISITITIYIFNVLLFFLAINLSGKVQNSNRFIYFLLVSFPNFSRKLQRTLEMLRYIWLYRGNNIINWMWWVAVTKCNRIKMFTISKQWWFALRLLRERKYTIVLNYSYLPWSHLHGEWKHVVAVVVFLCYNIFCALKNHRNKSEHNYFNFW